MMMDDGFVSLGFNVLLLQSQLDIPFKVRAGHIGEDIVTVPICHLLSLFATFPLIRIGVFGFFPGQLQLKIPWKNLYNQSVEAKLDGVYLLVVPTASKILICI